MQRPGRKSLSKKYFKLLSGLGLLMLAGCHHYANNGAGNQSGYDSSTYLINYVGTPDAETYQPVTLMPAIVYKQADSTSAIVDRLPVLSSINITQKLEKTYGDTVKNRDGHLLYLSAGSNTWYRLKLGGDTLGYIARKYVANYSITDTAQHAIYIIGRKQPQGAYYLARYSLKDKKLTSEAILTAFNSDHIRVSEVRNIPMSGVVKMLRIDEDLENSGGAYTSQLVVDTDSGLLALPPTSISYDDGGGRDNKVLYVPARGSDDVIRLYIDADVHNDVHWSNYFIQSRTDIGVPPGKLLVYTQEAGETALDKNNEPIVLKNGHYQWKSHTKTATYYRWDGGKLIQVMFEHIPVQ